MSIGDFPESLSRAMLVGTMLLGRLGVSDASTVIMINVRVLLSFQQPTFQQLTSKSMIVQQHGLNKF